MKYAITIADTYKALVDINLDGKGAFDGKITSDEYGITQIEDGQVQPDGSLTGTASLGGHDAKFSATTDGDKISGDIRVGWLIHKTFDGFQTT